MFGIDFKFYLYLQKYYYKIKVGLGGEIMNKFDFKKMLVLFSIFLFVPSVVFAAGEGSILTNPWMLNGILILGFLLFLIGLFVPGAGPVEVVAAIFFILYFKTSIDMGVASFYSIMFFVIGIGLLILEVFVPGFGVVGVSGFIFTALGIITSSVSYEAALFNIFTITFTSVIFIMFVIRLGILSTRLDKFMLKSSIKNKGRDESAEKRGVSVGDIGVANTNLRPTGYATIQGSRWDVTAQSSFIDKGSEIEVVSIVSNKIVVKSAE